MSGWYIPTKVDKDDVPMLIQKLTYSYVMMHFVVDYFNGRMRYFSTDLVCPSMGLMQKEPNRMQFLEAENNIKLYSIEHWQEWFPMAEGRVALSL